jgi:hypothetical protein
MKTQSEKEFDKAVQVFKANPGIVTREYLIRQTRSYEIGRTEASRLAAMRSTREQIECALEADPNADVLELHARYNELMCA